jgi:hypothetical protein
MSAKPIDFFSALAGGSHYRSCGGQRSQFRSKNKPILRV